MKYAVRVLVLGLFAAGASAAVVSTHSTSAMTAITVSHQIMSPHAAVPTCSPWGGCPGGKTSSSSGN